MVSASTAISLGSIPNTGAVVGSTNHLRPHQLRKSPSGLNIGYSILFIFQGKKTVGMYLGMKSSQVEWIQRPLMMI